MLVGGLFQFDASFSFMRNVYDIIWSYPYYLYTDIYIKDSKLLAPVAWFAASIEMVDHLGTSTVPFISAQTS